MSSLQPHGLDSGHGMVGLNEGGELPRVSFPGGDYMASTYDAASRRFRAW